MIGGELCKPCINRGLACGTLLAVPRKYSIMAVMRLQIPDWHSLAAWTAERRGIVLNEWSTEAGAASRRIGKVRPWLAVASEIQTDRRGGAARCGKARRNVGRSLKVDHSSEKCTAAVGPNPKSRFQNFSKMAIQ